MVYFGTIMEIDKDKTYVFTLDCDMVSLKTKEEYYLGEQVSFTKKDIYKSSNVTKFAHSKQFKILSSVAAVFLFAVIIASVAFILGRGSVGFDERCMAVVSVDINPSVEFNINKNDEIISANYYNDEGKEIVESLDLKGMALQAGIDEVVAAAKQLGYINEEVNIVLVSATLYDDETDNSYAAQLKNVLQGIEGSNDGTSIMAVYIEDNTIFDYAENNDVTIGKALLYQYALSQGLSISLDDIKGSSITELLSLIEVQVDNLEVETQEPTTEEETTTEVAEETTTQATTTQTTTKATSSWMPKLNAYNSNGKLYFEWTPTKSSSITYNGKNYYGFKYCKIAYSKTDSTPTYPENSYLYYSSDYYKSSYIHKSEAGGKLESGGKYYFAITYVFENGSFSSNVRYLTAPTYASPTYVDFNPTFTVTNDTTNNKVTFTWDTTPSEYVKNNGTKYSDFYYYKTVVSESKDTTTPRYPDDGYMDAISNTSVGSVSYNYNTSYNGHILESGKKYCFGVTYVYSNGKIYTYWSDPVTIP